MKILHCCLAGIYAEGCGYQENNLTELQKAAGHDVRVLTSTEILEGGKPVHIAPGRYETASGISVIRLPYASWVPSPLKAKLRIYPDFAKELASFAPDIIFFHGAATYELCSAAKYRGEHPETTLFVDSHAASYNSATNLVSEYLLHKGLYRHWYKRSRAYIDRLYYIGYYEKLYLLEYLNADEASMESLPLGGEMIDSGKRSEYRIKIRKELGLSDEHIIFLHSGKLTAPKRTRELLDAFSRIPDERFRLLIIGHVPDDLQPILDKAVSDDSRIIPLGWMNVDQLEEHMCACDVYMQPGTTSASMQRSLCCGTPALIYPHETYTHMFGSSGAVAYAKCTDDITDFLSGVSCGEIDLGAMRREAISFAAENLDYAEQVERISRAHQIRISGE